MSIFGRFATLVTFTAPISYTDRPKPVSEDVTSSFGSVCDVENREQGPPGVFAYMGFKGMFGAKGYGFSAALVINRVSILDVENREQAHPPGGGVFPYMGFIGMCGAKGYGFSAALVINRVSILAILVINRVSIFAL